MAGSSSSQGPASFMTQANALLRKNLTFQKRNYKTNAGLVTFPLFLCILMVVIQNIANNELNRAGLKCGCICTDTSRDGKCAKTECGIQYSDSVQAVFCPISKPPTWPVLSTVPQHENRAVRTESIPFSDLPDESCRSIGSCPATTLFTGGNQSFGQSLAENFYTSAFDFNSSDNLNTLADFYLGTYTDAGYTNFIEPGFTSDSPVYVLQPQCLLFPPFSVPIQISSMTLEKEVRCLRNLQLWRGSSSIVNDEIFKGYIGGNSDGNINEIVAAYDFLNSDKNNFNVTIWYNSTNNNGNGQGARPLVRAPRLANVVSNAYLRFLRGSGVKMLFDFVKEMPKLETRLTLDFTSVLGPLFFTWVVLQLFPVVMTSLVYEKQQNLRIMMKMHGLGDGPYWMISYAYFFFLSLTYMLCFVVFGSIIGLKFFTSNDYSIQFVFYFIYANLQIALAFLVSTLFSNFKIATVMGHIYVFGSGLLGAFLFQFFVQETSFPRVWIVLMEMFPGFSLYRGLYEFGQSARADGMRWRDLNDSTNGMSEVLLIMFVEWFIILPVAYYFDQVVSIGSGVRKHPLFFLKNFQKKRSLSFKWSSWGGQGSKVSVRMEKSDVSLEREKVKQLLLESSINYAIISDDLKKMYPGKDGNPGKFAVKGMSLALPQGECFGMLGPNGAGKTSFINMMIGLVPPSSGTAFIHGMDIRTDMDKIYTSMGVCPQHDLLWETLTGREHLLFYGRLKNLKGVALSQAVEESLRSVNLFHGGVGDKRVGKYSGGMKRRLSVATSLIGDPKVVYMDEPSTGLDPASRNNLWNVVKRAKQDRAIILTTHSMEEAEVLCDRLGIFVDGSLQCIGNPKELKARYGGSYVFTMTTSVSQEKEVEKLVKQLSSSANRIYHISGTQKFELRKDEVRIADIFQAVANAKEKFIIHAWGLADTTLEDVFIKVAQVDQAFNQLS